MNASADSLERCAASIVAIDSITTSLRDVIDSPVSKTILNQIIQLLKHALVLGLTIFSLSDKLKVTAPQDVPPRFHSAIKTMSSVTDRSVAKIQKSTRKIINQACNKSIAKISKVLDSIAYKLDILIDAAHLPTITRTAFSLKHVVAENLAVLRTYTLEDVQEAMKVWNVNESLGNQLLMDAKSSSSAILPSVSTVTNSSPPNTTFISRVASTSRPPNADLDKAWPIITEQLAAASLTESIYDSYHDHEVDATLGLSDVNAVAALKRQASHKRSIRRGKAELQYSKIPTPTRARTFSDASQETVARVMTVNEIERACPSPVDFAIRDQYY